MNGMLKKPYISVTVVICFILIMGSIFYKINITNQYTQDVSIDKLDKDSKNKTVVEVWLPKDEVSDTRTYQVKRFNKKSKDTYILLKTYYRGDYSNILRTSLAAEKGPDIMLYSFFELIKENKLKNLDFINDKDKNKFVYYENKPIGARINEQNVKLVWNKDILQKAGLNPNVQPRTWEELINYAETIKEKCPSIIPFQFPIKDYQDFKTSIGEPSVNFGNIYTSFWDFKNAEYNFDYSRNILEAYNELYHKKLLDKDFYKKSKSDLRMDFYNGDVAMYISTFEDKGYYSNMMPLNFDIGISNLPKFDMSSNDKQYFLSNSNFLSINNDISKKSYKEKKAIKEVFNWLISENNNKEILTTRMAMSPNSINTNVKHDIYKEYNDISKFYTEVNDPSIYISRNSQETIKLSIEAIKGKKTINQVINKLNDNYNEYCEFTKKNRKIDLESFKE